MSRFPSERLCWSVVRLLGALPPLAVVMVVAYLALRGLEALAQIPLAELAAASWSPLSARFGLLPLLMGTLAATLAALLLAIPVGLGAALYVVLWAGPRVRTVAEAAIGLLGGLPSVVVGLWGMTWIVPVVGHSLAAAALILALMIAPTFTLLAGAALRQVPANLPETVRALGVGENVLARVVVRQARWGVLGAAVLAACRALGEAVAVSLVAGNVALWPELNGPIATLTTTLIVEFSAAAGLHAEALYLLALIAVLLIATVSITGRALSERRSA